MYRFINHSNTTRGALCVLAGGFIGGALGLSPAHAQNQNQPVVFAATADAPFNDGVGLTASVRSESVVDFSARGDTEVRLRLEAPAGQAFCVDGQFAVHFAVKSDTPSNGGYLRDGMPRFVLGDAEGASVLPQFSWDFNYMSDALYSWPTMWVGAGGASFTYIELVGQAPAAYGASGTWAAIHANIWPATLCPRAGSDRDGDGVTDAEDAFPDDPAESSDRDDDGVGDNADAFPDDPAESSDRDDDGVGDNADAFPDDPAESSDRDDDGVGDNADAFPDDASESSDGDGDGVGDGDDPCVGFPNDDTDGDGVCNSQDLCPTDPLNADADADLICDVDDLCLGDNSTHDTDGDQVCDDRDACIGNDALGDFDHDGLCNDLDNCPVDANPDQVNLDGDTWGDVCDADDDGDGTDDIVDNCPGLANIGQFDSDGDRLGDACDDDDDNDGFVDAEDNCPLVANPDQADADGDLSGDTCDDDDDADTVLDAADLCPNTPLGALVGADGCTGGQAVEAACGAEPDPSCITQSARQAKQDGLITPKAFAQMVSNAAKNQHRNNTQR